MRALLVANGLEDAVEVCSAGLGDWHVGETADHRSIAELAARGYDADRHRARQFDPSWFAHHDLIVAMDRTHLRALQGMAPRDQQDKVSLLMSYAGDDADVPDPYYGGADGFAHALDMIEQGCRGLLATVHQRLSA